MHIVCHDIPNFAIVLFDIKNFIYFISNVSESNRCPLWHRYWNHILIYVKSSFVMMTIEIVYHPVVDWFRDVLVLARLSIAEACLMVSNAHEQFKEIIPVHRWTWKREVILFRWNTIAEGVEPLSLKANWSKHDKWGWEYNRRRYV